MKQQRENRKVTYTKMVIKDSLFTLLAEKNLHQISVKELCELADINRGTFYTHYADLYDLVDKLEAELAEKSRQIASFFLNEEPIISHEMVVHIFRHIQDNIESYRLILLNPSSVKCLEPLLAEAYEQYIAFLVDQHGLHPVIGDYTFTFITSGFESVVRQWIDGGMEQSPEEIATHLNTLIRNGTTALVA